MNKNEYMISIEGLKDRKAFFTEVLSFYSPYNVIITTWGKLHKDIKNCLAPFSDSCNWFRHLIFNENNWHLNKDSIGKIRDCLCSDNVVKLLTWGIHKNDTPLCLYREPDDIFFDGSDLIEEEVFLEWIKDIKSKGIIGSFEIINERNGEDRNLPA